MPGKIERMAAQPVESCFTLRRGNSSRFPAIIPVHGHYRHLGDVPEEFRQGKYLSGVSGIVYKQIDSDGNAIVPDRYRPTNVHTPCPLKQNFGISYR